MTRRTAERNERFYAFYTSNREVSNAKTPDVKGEFTDFTDFTVSVKGVYVASTQPPAPARARLYTYPLFSRCKIRKIRKTARRQGGISARYSPPGVKPVKSTVGTDMEATL
jgi:hypothetical protein